MTSTATAPRNAAARPPQRRSSPKPPKPPKDARDGSLSAWKNLHMVVVIELNGAGRRYRFMCYKYLVPLKAGGSARFVDLMHEFSVAALYDRGHCAEGDDPRDACARLAERNGWEKP
jgi:hypothetical protein